MQVFLHYFLHFGFPLVIALVFFRKEWKKVYGILLATMLIDLDHLFANPIFQADRCSIGFHFLHSYEAMIFYFVLFFLPKSFKIIGFGLFLHLLTDLIDCLWMYNACNSCFADGPALGLVQAISDFLGY